MGTIVKENCECCMTDDCEFCDGSTPNTITVKFVDVNLCDCQEMEEPLRFVIGTNPAPHFHNWPYEWELGENTDVPPFQPAQSWDYGNEALPVWQAASETILNDAAGFELTRVDGHYTNSPSEKIKCIWEYEGPYNIYCDVYGSKDPTQMHNYYDYTWFITQGSYNYPDDLLYCDHYPTIQNVLGQMKIGLAKTSANTYRLDVFFMITDRFGRRGAGGRVTDQDGRFHWKLWDRVFYGPGGTIAGHSEIQTGDCTGDPFAKLINISQTAFSPSRNSTADSIIGCGHVLTNQTSFTEPFATFPMCSMFGGILDADNEGMENCEDRHLDDVVDNQTYGGPNAQGRCRSLKNDFYVGGGGNNPIRDWKEGEESPYYGLIWYYDESINEWLHDSSRIPACAWTVGYGGYATLHTS